MGQGDEFAMLDSSLRWTEDQSPKRDAAVEGINNNNMNPRDSGSVISQGPGGADDIRSFFDNETLCSRSGSLSHRLHPRPLHHYPNQPNHMKSRTHADFSHAHAPDSEDLHSLERPKPPLQPQRQRCTPAKIDASDCVDQNQDLGEHSFLFSRPTSIATMAMTTTTMDDYADQYPPFRSSLNRHWRDEDQIELRVPSDTRPDNESLRHNMQQYHDLLSEIDTECLFPEDSLFTADRPSSSRSHLLQWRRNQSPNSDSSKHLRVCSDAQPPTSESRPSTTITREEFEALPPTIQRKYFSTIERSQLAHSPDLSNRQRAGSVGHDQSLSPWSSLSTSRGSYEHQERPVTSDASIIHSDRPPRITSTDQRFYANLPEKIKRRHLTEEELLIAYDLDNVSTEATEEVSDKPNKHQLQDVKMQSPLSSPGLSDGQSSFSSMLPRQNNRGGSGSDVKRSESFYDSFRWLEDEEGLDLRLYLDDYHINLREEVPVPNNKSRRPSFRRHLSINKLPFGRPSVSCSRAGIGDDALPSSGIPSSASHSSRLGSSGHVRRKSRARALSLISANKQAPISPPPLTPPIDPAATHYQDPEARKKLRAYLASPQKFDEAIEFGFPSKDGSIPRPATYSRTAELNKNSGHETDKLRSFLEDDRSSKYSDDASAAEPDSPKTPQLFDKTPHIRSLRNSIEHPSYSRGEKSLQDPATSREMTLRMTLTRPDLRQSEDQIYGWKQSSGSRGGSSREEPAPNPVIYAREGNPKQSIEKQLAALDQWDDQPDQDNGPVKRLWNRVKRS
ncbi:hypothetical protein NW762_000684 [Fusarium torreyae]|uniref:Mucin n=1 Tax=Fusarium torreyae TaxID=1237075 RepID=A0A9W8SHQ5_9HYPO|nr:hypothetical protein NW762_000684 [Fusarium torreyae]